MKRANAVQYLGSWIEKNKAEGYLMLADYAPLIGVTTAYASVLAGGNMLHRLDGGEAVRAIGTHSKIRMIHRDAIRKNPPNYAHRGATRLKEIS